MTQTKLFTTRRFLPLFATQFLGAFNDNLLKNALVILITYKGAAVWGIPPAQVVAAAGGIFILPFFLFSAQSGQLADKLEKSRLIRLVKLAEIAIMTIAAVGFVFHMYEWLLVSLFLMGVHSTVFGPIKYSILPQHLTEEEIVGGNALVEAGTNLAILLGTIAGGVLVMIDPYGPKIIAAGIVGTAVVGWLTSLAIPEAPAADPSLEVQWNPVTPTVRILGSVRGTRAVFLSILGISWFWFFGGFLLSMFPSYCKDFLGATNSVATLFLCIFSIGIAVGSVLCEALSRESLELGLVPLGSIGMTLFAADLFFLGRPELGPVVGVREIFTHWPGIRLAADLFMLSVFSGFYIVPLYTLIQTRSEKSQRSRVVAANNIMNAAFMVVSAGLLVFMSAKLTPPQIFLTLAVMNSAVAAYIYGLLPEFLLRFMFWVCANVLYRLKIRGPRVLPKTGAAILVCNHVSFVDWMIIAAAVKRPVRFIMDHGFAKGPIMRRLVRDAKIIPIAPARVSPELMEEAFRRAAAELREGAIVCIFPEGKITADGALNAFKPGIERLVRETPVPVIPMALSNLWGSFFSRKGGPALMKRPRRFWSRIELRFGAPVAPQDVTAAGLQAKVAELLGEPPSARPPVSRAS